MTQNALPAEWFEKAKHTRLEDLGGNINEDASVAPLQVDPTAAITPRPTGEFGAPAPTAGGENDDTALPEEMMRIGLEKPHEGVTAEMRLWISTIRERPDWQVQYFRNKGLNARLGENDEVLIDDRPFRGTEDSFQDYAEWIPDIMKGVIETVATSGKIAGAIAAPFTGGSSLGGAMAAGGAMGGAMEALEQYLSIQAGARQEADPGKVLKEATLGATIPAAVHGLGKMIGGGLDKAVQHRKEITEATEDISGGKPTSAMLAEPGSTKREILAQAEGATSDLKLGVFGIPKRRQRDKIRKGAEQTMKDILYLKSERSGLEVGDKFLGEIKASVSKKLEPAEKLYDEVAEHLGDIPAEKAGLLAALEKLKTRMKFSTEGQKTISSIESKIESIETLDDLKLFRTSVRDEISPTAPKNVKAVVDDMYSAATKSRSDSFKAALKKGDKITAPEGEAWKVWRKELSRRYKSLHPRDQNKIVNSFNGGTFGERVSKEIREKNRKLNEFGSHNETDYWHTELGEGLDDLRKQALKESPDMFRNQLKGFAAKDPEGNLLASQAKQKAKFGLREKFKTPEVDPKLKGLEEKIIKADKLYAETASLVQNALMARGKKMKQGVRQEATLAVEGIKETKRREKFFPKDDPRRIQALKELSPEAHETLRSDIMSEIYNKSISTAEGRHGQLNYKKVIAEIDKMDADTAIQTFGEHSLKKKESLKKVIGAFAGDINPPKSGSFPSNPLVIAGHQLATAGFVALDNVIKAGSSDAVRKTALYLLIKRSIIEKEPSVNTDSNSTKLRKAEEKQIINRRGNK